MKEGKVIVFEGLDKCGKTTQLFALKKWLKYHSWNAVHLHTSLLANKDVTYMKIHSVSKFFCYIASLHEASNTICQLKKDFDFILVDRYLLSQIAYTSGFPSKLTPEQRDCLNYDIATSILEQPDVVFYFTGKLFGRRKTRADKIIEVEFNNAIKELTFDYHWNIQIINNKLPRKHITQIIRNYIIKKFLEV